MIEVMFAIRKDKFKDYPAVVEGLDLIQEDDQITHLISLDDDDIVEKDMLSKLGRRMCLFLVTFNDVTFIYRCLQG